MIDPTVSCEQKEQRELQLSPSPSRTRGLPLPGDNSIPGPFADIRFFLCPRSASPSYSGSMPSWHPPRAQLRAGEGRLATSPGHRLFLSPGWFWLSQEAAQSEAAFSISKPAPCGEPRTCGQANQPYCGQNRQTSGPCTHSHHPPELIWNLTRMQRPFLWNVLSQFELQSPRVPPARLWALWKWIRPPGKIGGIKNVKVWFWATDILDVDLTGRTCRDRFQPLGRAVLSMQTVIILLVASLFSRLESTHGWHVEDFPWFPEEQSSVVTTEEGARQGLRAREAGQG